MSDFDFLVGADLVEFDRRDLPIYESHATGWAQAGGSAAVFGTPLDRLFGDPGEEHVAGALASAELDAVADGLVEDPLVVLASLSDGVVQTDAADPATMAGMDGQAQAVVPLHDDGVETLSAVDWTFDFHA